MDEPFLLHNVDVISTIDLARMVQFHKENQALATLAVMQRESSRQLLFNDAQRLCGRRKGSGHLTKLCGPARSCTRWRLRGCMSFLPGCWE